MSENVVDPGSLFISIEVSLDLWKLLNQEHVELHTIAQHLRLVYRYQRYLLRWIDFCVFRIEVLFLKSVDELERDIDL